MKITATLVALLLSVSFTFAADEAKKPGGDKTTDKPAAKAPTEAQFTKKDANGDKKVSKEEFIKDAKDPAKAETSFGRKDKDKDGSLSLEEFVAVGGKKKTEEAK